MIHRLGRLEEATSLFEEVYRSDPANTQVGSRMAERAARARHFGTRHRFLVLPELRLLQRSQKDAASEPDPDPSSPPHPQVYSLLGNNLCKLKRWAEAAPVLQAALAEGADLNTRYNYAVCLLNTDNRPEAKDAFEEVLREDAEYDLALDALAMLNARFGAYIGHGSSAPDAARCR